MIEFRSYRWRGKVYKTLRAFTRAVDKQFPSKAIGFEQNAMIVRTDSGVLRFHVDRNEYNDVAANPS